jgi:hypothetical protein
MYDYPETTKNYEDREFCALTAIHQTLTWALELPNDPDFGKLCRTVENLHSAQGIINQIREKYNNPDDLATIKAAIEAMQEE